MTDSVTATGFLGGWIVCEKEDVSNKVIGEFAVDEYNKKQDKSLEFVKVLTVEKPCVNGLIMYKLSLEAKDDDGSKIYEALVYVNSNDCMQLLEFKSKELDHHVIIGGWTDAGNDVGIEDLAKFAVDEYNKKEGTTLEFTKLKNAQKQHILYRLTLEATDDGHTNLYQAMVIVVPRKNIKELEDFKPLPLKIEVQKIVHGCKL